MAGRRRRRGISFGTVFMLLFTALVVAACVLFLTMILGTDVYARTEEFIRTLSDEGMFVQTEFTRTTPVPRRIITFIEDTPAPAAPATPTPVPEKRTIRLAVGGAVYAPKAVRQSAQNGSGYDFSAAFEGVKGVFGAADLSIATLETAAAGQSLGLDSHNAPPELLDALRDCGVDLLALATERALDKGYEGLDLTISELTRRGMAYSGLNPESGSRATMMRIGGVQVAVLSYAYGLSESGIKQTDSDARGVVARMNAEVMIQDVKQARVDGANLVIVLPHWGTKNKQETADTVRILAKRLAEAGADVILGAHPNVVQGTERLCVTRSDGLTYETIVCYSLGSLMTDSRAKENTAGMIAQLDVTYDPVTRRTELGGLTCVPVYIASQREAGGTVYRVVNAQDETELGRLESSEQKNAAAAAEYVISAAKDESAAAKKRTGGQE